MLVLGYTGGLDLVHQNRSFLFPAGWLHDSAAVLVEDGKILSGIEEERLNRIKHTNKAPVAAIRFCLETRKASIKDIDRFYVAGSEMFMARGIRKTDLSRVSSEPLPSPRGLIHEILQRGLGEDIDDDKIYFVPHHLAHAVSAYAVSGFDQSLIFTADGGGDDIAGMVATAHKDSINIISKTPMLKSLGLFYLSVIEFIGFGLFEEYKVMGLAPYGNPSRYRSVFQGLYELRPGGDYVFNMDLPDCLSHLCRPRKRKDPVEQVHKDIAASLQESLEKITFHILSHHRKETEQTNLCLAGGVAHNCTLNGKILYSGLFDNVFVQPASHDGGLALGAALYPFMNGNQASVPSRFDHVYIGSDIGASEAIHSSLEDWNEFIEFEHVTNIAEQTARLISEGSVIGWVQGRSEFGPRALGNRSIVADPRPAENKELINQMVKKREGYRPFAPAVLEEYAAEFFEIASENWLFPFMVFVAQVRGDKRDILKATTHVDGSARIQTVSKSTNPKFWELINAFREIVGIPVLLNTSFNNNVEPIVNSVEDSIVCYLTTQLNHLVVGDYLISKRRKETIDYLNLKLALPLYVRLVQTRSHLPNRTMNTAHAITTTSSEMQNLTISQEMFSLLSGANGNKTVAELIAQERIHDPEKVRTLAEELQNLWVARRIILKPR